MHSVLSNILIFFAGFLIGQFLNAIIIRLPQGKSWSYDSSPQSLPLRSLLVKGFSGLISLLFYNKYGLSVDFAAFVFFMYILIIIFLIDLEHQIIPNELVIVALSGGVLVFLYNFFWPFLIYKDHYWWNPLLGLVSGSGFLLAVAIIGSLLYKNDEVMGMGDVKLFAPIGLFLGWRMTLLALFLSVILGGMTSLLLILTGKATRKSTIPFGPFIVIGVFITLIWGWDIADWYLRAFWYY